MKGLPWLLLAACCARPGTASAAWLSLGSRAISLSDSADPDAPAVGYAFGPRARASLGLDVALLTLPSVERAFRLGLVTLVAWEDAEQKRLLPSQQGRSLLALSASWAYQRPFSLPEGYELEWALALGRRTAFVFDQFVLADRYRTRDVPFGAGGNYLGLDFGLRTPLGPRFQTTSRLTLRAYTNALPAAVGQTEASDYVASGLEEGAKISAALELGTRFRLAARAEPVLRLYADVIEPHDDSAKRLWLVRSLAGVALLGAQFELEPYVDAEAGHGQAYLVNRTQLRLGVGVRLYAR